MSPDIHCEIKFLVSGGVVLAAKVPRRVSACSETGRLEGGEIFVECIDLVQEPSHIIERFRSLFR